MKKVPEWEFWDWRSIIYGALITIGLISVFYYFEVLPDRMRTHHSKNYKKTTHAYFIKSHRIDNPSQSLTGTVTTTDGYEITYLYSLNQKQYIANDKISNSVHNQKFIGKLVAGEIQEFIIKYDSITPSKSQIEIDSIVP